jgi:hypothetical protein
MGRREEGWRSSGADFRGSGLLLGRTRVLLKTYFAGCPHLAMMSCSLRVSIAWYYLDSGGRLFGALFYVVLLLTSNKCMPSF